MESHRLKPMIENYDPKVFKVIYEQTAHLRRKLASGIDHHRFGVQPEDILSWFDDKFIFVFNRYYNSYSPEVLKGHIINALSLFKNRILRAAYTAKYSQHIIHVEDAGTLADHFIDTDSNTSPYQEMFYTFMKSKLSDNAFYLLQLQLNPPPYILNQINKDPEAKKLDKISDDIIIDYLDLPYNKKTLKFLSGLREEIKLAISQAKRHFTTS